MTKEKLERIIGGSTFVSLFFPVVFLKSNHSCGDGCFQIWYNGHLGMCIEKAIDNTCFFIAIAWWSIVIGSAIIWSKKKNSTSPFWIMAMLFTCAFGSAVLDPKKWSFVISIIPSLILIVTAKTLDTKK